ncbi:N-acetylmuramoyl-L-alanine amidase [Rossellomorea marisflavi]|uniref:N-acetylmuramoyl-L-alanine amidase n=1 Tax=Rossellomorea marisflavi TaxID=189381 RepID=UPI0011E7C05E|nr:N-acetylmuramoyl-L-alanine amidase [Rossellomorea marisflavi]TYO72494.1 sporulation protein [Rossellomorea marisflavi]
MKVIMIDPGHGGSDPGASYKGHEEKYYNLLIALGLRDFLLKHYQVNVIMTRESDRELSLEERSRLANARGVDFFLSIHHNAGGGTGFESYIYDGRVSNDMVSLQATIHNEIVSSINKHSVVDRGKKRANFHVLRETTMNALLVEVLFIDRDTDVALMQSPAFRSDVVSGLGKGVAKALALPDAQKATFKVIAGSFSDRKNAEERVEELAARKIDSFITSLLLDGKTYYRVQAGAFADRQNAENLVQTLKGYKIDAFLVVEGAVSSVPPVSPPKPTNTPKPTPPPQSPSKPGYSILGESVLKGHQLDEFARKVNPAAPLLGAYYATLGRLYGIRGDVAYAQALHETNFFRFTGQVKASQNNYAGIGTTGPGADGAQFSTPEEGVHAHLQHLFAYATTSPLPGSIPLIDPRFSLVKRGIARDWTDLNGKWAVPGTTYGQMILALHERNLSDSIASSKAQILLMEDAMKQLMNK